MKPKYIVCFFMACLIVLGILCFVFPAQGIAIGVSDVTLSMPSPTSMMGGDAPSAPLTIAEEPPIGEAVPQDSVSVEDSIVEVEPVRTPHFRARLKQDTAVRVVYYGDSQIEGDRMTMIVRRYLQGKFGGGGVGLIPLHQTISMRTLYQTLTMNGEKQEASGGPQRYMVFGPKTNRRDNSLYGPMGHVSVMDNELVDGSEDVVLNVMPQGDRRGSESYFSQVRVLSSNGNRIIPVKDSTLRYTLHLQGKQDIYGISLETPHGVIVDNIPMRGCAGTVFTMISKRQLTDYYAATNTQVIILQYGGNVMPYTKNEQDITKYVNRVIYQVRYLRQCAPDAAFLFVGPSDMLTKVNGQKQTYPLLPAMDNALRTALEQEEDVYYFSLFRAMGGAGSMLSWIEQGLAGSDGVHFTRKGSDKAGQLLCEYIEKLMD